MTEGDLAYLPPEVRARVGIDRMLTAAGWAVQDAARANLSQSRGVAVREFVMRAPHGRADYLLFLDGHAAGVIEAKKEGETLTGVEWQSAKYVDGLPEELEPAVEGGLAFVYESTGAERRFTNRLDPEPASRAVFSFHQPETLSDWLEDLRRHKPPFSRPATVPEGLDWPSLLEPDGDALEVHYRHVLTELGRKGGMLGVVFRKAQNRIQDPAKLRRLVADLIDRESWLTLDADVKGDTYEGLLERNAEDVKSGAGQYFTPRPLIRAIVEVMQPEPGMRIADPACGTGGFLLAAHESIAKGRLLDPDEKRQLRYEAPKGWEIVDNTARLCVMNLLLHGIGDEEHDSPIVVDDALKADSGERFEMVLTNPPFGRKSSMMFVSEEGDVAREDLVVVRDDFWASTSNKQLNFVQHVKALLAINGRAAVVVPDNVLFEGGAGETVRRRLLEECDVHTLLRLPTGVFYAQGVADDRSRRAESERFHRFGYDELMARDKASLDISWLRDDSLEDTENLPPPEVIAQEIVEDLEAALAHFTAVAESLGRGAADPPSPG